MVTSHSPIVMAGGLLPSPRIWIIHTSSNLGLLLDWYSDERAIMNNKRKRGRPKKYLTRSKDLHILMYEEEYEQIKRKADKLGISISTFMMLAAREYLYKK